MTEDQALERLTGILARPEFHAAAAVSLLELLTEAITMALSTLVTALLAIIVRSATGEAGLVGYLLLAVGFLLIVALAAGLVRAVRLSVGGGAAETARAAAARRERADRLWREAQQLAGAGQYPEAIRALYLCALYSLEEQAALRVQESLTNREHAERAARSLGESVRQGFDALVQRYDRVRYGHYPADEATFLEVRDLVQRTRAAVQQAAG